jgi:hypothetical protein
LRWVGEVPRARHMHPPCSACDDALGATSGYRIWRGGVSPDRSGARTRPVKRPSWTGPPPSRSPLVALLAATDDQRAQSNLVSEPPRALDTQEWAGHPLPFTTAVFTLFGRANAGLSPYRRRHALGESDVPTPRGRNTALEVARSRTTHGHMGKGVAKANGSEP